MLYKRILPFIIALFAIPSLIDAQITTSSMTGTVKSVEGENLVGATISATHQPTGTNYTTVSRTGGSFSIPNMRSGGPYLVLITYVGYKTDTNDNINLQLGEPFLLNSVLEKSSASLEGVVITTSGKNTIFNANRTGASTNVGIAQIQRMPSITRNLNDLLKISPQANGASVGGGNFRQNYITVDGSDFNNTFGIGNNLPAGGSPISLDALAEISINITPFDIRQSGFIGSAVNAVTRSGTNNIAGTAYYYWRSEKQQGEKVNKTTFVRNPFNFKQYGASIGFPVIPNKLFVFVNYETENQPKQVSTRFASSPGAPYTGTGSIARPSVDSLNLISEYLLSKYGYVTGPFQGYSTQISREKFLARIDWNINSKNRFNIRYNQVEGGEPNPPSTSRSPMSGYTTGTGRTDINHLWFQNSNYFQGANFYSLAAELNSTIGGKLANTLRGTYTFQNDSRQTTSSFFPFVDILSFGTPYTSFGYEPFSYGNLRKVKTFSVVDNVTWTLNRNQITVGGQLDHSTTINGFQRFAASYYTFASFNDFATGQKPLDFGITYSLSPGYAQAFPSFKFAQLSFYAQDEITATKNLRITLGLRGDRPSYPGVAEIKTHPLVAALTFANGEKINTGVLPSAKILWSPRLGFNWDVYGDRSLQVRGGTGIFTGRVPFVWIVSQSGDAGLLQVTSVTETPTALRNGSPANFNTPGPFNPNPAAYLPSTQPVAGTVIPSTISALRPNFKFPSAWKTSLAFDKKIGGGLIFTMEGIINKDINPTVFRNPNLVTPTPLNVSGYPDNRLFYPSAVKDRFINPLTAAAASATNPNPSTAVPNGDARGTQSFNTIVMDNTKGGYYASLVVRLEKQFSKGFYGSIAYVASMADNKFDGNGDQPLSAWQGTANVNGSNYPELGNASYIVPSRIIASLSYRKEYLRHLATTISLTYEGSSEGRFSYTYGGSSSQADFNRDGTSNDLIYIPTDPSQITFVNKTVGSGATAVTFTPQQQSDAFFKYIDQDKYLRTHKGEYSQRNAVNKPWRNEVNVKLLQDLFVNVGKKRNTIQFSLDIFNFGNLINPNWGILHTTNAPGILIPTNGSALVTGGTVKPTFQLANVGNDLISSTYRENVSIFSTYFMQFGLRYIFN